jgi:hypothetical protein
MASTLLEQQLGLGEAGDEDGEDATPGARMTSKVDPARSLGHGHASGVRRRSRQEKDQAEQ